MTNMEAFKRLTLDTVDPVIFMEWQCSAQKSCDGCKFKERKPEWYSGPCIWYWQEQEFETGVDKLERTDD